MESFDQGLWNWFQAHRTPGLDCAVTAISTLGTLPVLGSLLLLTVLALLWQRKQVSALAVAATLVSSFLLVGLIQTLIGRERPEVGYRPLETAVEAFCFPSEHAWMAAATYLAIAWGIADLVSGMRRFALGAAVVLALAVGISRLFVGVCYPTDVLAGWIGGFCMATLLRSVAKLGGTVEKRN